MSLPTKLRKRGKWPGIPPEVAQAFTDLEKNVSDAVDELASRQRPKWNVVKVTTAEPYLASLWDLVMVTHDGATTTINVPAASAANKGAEICITRRGSAGVVIKAVQGQLSGPYGRTLSFDTESTIVISTGEEWICVPA